MPFAEVPAVLPPGVKPLLWRGRVFLVTAFVSYGPGSVLTYDEFLVLLVARAPRPSGTVTQIWVDSAASAAGGRALWGIPKELGRFDGTSLSLAGERAVSLRFTPGRRLPGRWPMTLRTLQSLDGRLKVTRLRARGRLCLGRGLWQFAEAGPLGFLAGRRPLATLRLEPLELRFGDSPAGAAE